MLITSIKHTENKHGTNAIITVFMVRFKSSAALYVYHCEWSHLASIKKYARH